ncbi:MAG: efflux RND transporter periplasmic adaptor subunit [Zoogloeaceae bacterium]|jgi:RND family efflux transporter MFP subunit|nr:efflux RND transporter periplasmic adaptor subunit [Zoogloeaceae bacterium]
MKKSHAFALAFAMAAAVLFFLRAVSAKSGAEADMDTRAAPRSALTVRVETPRLGTLPVQLTAHGDITAWQEAVIGSDMSDLRLSEVRADVGDAVRAGDVLAVFDDETVKIAVAQAEAALSEAEAAAREARENARRARALESSGALSEQAILQYVTAEQSAEARVQTARARLSAEQLRLKRTRVRAPDHGVISARKATVGAVSGLGGELFRMVRQGRLEWRAELQSSELSRVVAGTPVVLTLPGGEKTTGKLRMLAPTLDAAKRSGLAYVDLPKGSPARPGMFAQGVFDLGQSAGYTTPLAAVVKREPFQYLFVLDADGRARQVKVTTGRRQADRVEILHGLENDARVIVTGAGFLNDGDRVRVELGTDSMAN